MDPAQMDHQAKGTTQSSHSFLGRQVGLLR